MSEWYLRRLSEQWASQGTAATMTVETPAKNLLFSTAPITVESGSSRGSGTGFFFSVHVLESTGVGQAFFLVTNKHVVAGANLVNFVMTTMEGGLPVVGRRIEVGIRGQIEDDWFGHPAEDVDITVLPISRYLTEAAQANSPAFIRALSPDLLPTEEDTQTLDVVEDVHFAGYPSGIYDELNLFPVIRRGITATPFRYDFEGSPRFLIDASVFPGSSGSPVVLFKNTQSPRIGDVVKFLGVVAAVMTQTDLGSIEFLDIPTGRHPVVRIQHVLDLGLVLKSRLVLECVDAFLESRGMSRIAPPSP